MPTSPEIFVVAAVCLRDSAGRILTVRKRGTKSFMLPGGKIEPGETPAQTAVREIAEEVGLHLAAVVPLGHFVAAAANEPGHLVDSEVFTAQHVGTPVVSARSTSCAGWTPTTSTASARRSRPFSATTY